MALTPAMNPFGSALTPAWTLADARAALVRRSRLLLIAFAALSAGAVAAVVTAPLVYEGGFKLLVKRDRADAVVSGAAAADALRPEMLSENELLSQVELLKAQDLRETVAVESGLTQRLVASGKARTDEEALARALKALDKNLQVTPIRKTWLIDVTYRDEDPQVARRVLESTVQAFFAKHLTLNRPSGSFEFFSEQVDRSRQELEAAQAALVAFTRRAGVVAADAEKQATLQKLAEFEAMRAQAEAELAAATRRQAAARAELAGVPETRVAQSRVTQNPGAVQQIQSKILELELRRTELLQRFTPEYRGVVETEQQLQDARAALAQALDTRIHEETVADNPTRQWLDAELVRGRTDNAALEARVKALSNAVGHFRAEAQRLGIHSTEQNDLVRQVTAAEERYRLYLSKQEEARISDELDKTRITNVAVAQPPALKHEAKRRPSLAMLPLLIVAALIVSAALALAADALSAAPAGAALPVDEALHAARMSTAALSSRIARLTALTNSLSAKGA